MKTIPADWQPMSSAPRDGSDITVFHQTHGALTARFCPGEWTEHHEYGREYNGAVWCIGDDMDQEEVEEYPVGEFHDGLITHWMPKIDAPTNPPCAECGHVDPCDEHCPNHIEEDDAEQEARNLRYGRLPTP